MANEEEPPNSILSSSFFFFLHNHRDHHSLSSSYSFINGSIIDIIFRNNNKKTGISVFYEGGVTIIIVMLVLLIIIVIIVYKYKPWRYLFPSSPSRIIMKADDLEKPLVSDDLSQFQIQDNEFAKTRDVDGAGHQSQGGFGSPLDHGLAPEQKVLSPSAQLAHSDSFVLDIPDYSQGALVDQRLRRPLVTIQPADGRELGRKEETKCSSRFDINGRRSRDFNLKTAGSNLILEVITGPSRGLRYSTQSKDPSKLPVTLGRVLPNDVSLKDSEVSGNHALINWNANKLKWELVDMGSLNGTLLNSKAIHHPLPGSRRLGDPVEVSSGDVITLGTKSRISVKISSDPESQSLFGVGVASDPMALRRGGRKLPMEDVCFYNWPLSGTDQFGLFGLCDGHGGAAAAKSVSKIMPEMIAKILLDSYKREQVLTKSDASDVLREAFSQTEASINHEYEGCTATVLLLWADDHKRFYAQCANVGDSACFIDIDGNQIKMTEDHRVTSYSERLRIQAMGEPLGDGQTRLYGLNLARMLGDKFLKEQDARFSSEPYVSEVVCIHPASRAFVLLASDGFWDVIDVKKAAELVQEIKEKDLEGGNNLADRIANSLLNEASTKRTKDNTSIMFLDFDCTNILHSCKQDP